jgi:preprotein translocase subunit SecE
VRAGAGSREFVNYLTKLAIWAVVIGGVFAFAWWRGYLLSISTYWQETMVELKKCTWPSWDELKGSTVLISVCIALLGAFIVVADLIFVKLVFLISKV